MAVGIIAGPSSAPTRPGLGDAGLGEPSQEQQSIPARLWQDPLEATEAVRRALRVGHVQGAEAHNFIPFEQLIHEHTAFDGVLGPDGTVDYRKHSHRVLFQFVSLPSDAYPEASEQRIRARVAIVSALSTAGYRPANAARLGLAVWDEASLGPAITSQIAYPFEVFILDSVRNALVPEENQLSRMHDEIVVVYVEEGALHPERQFEWLKCLSRVLATASPPERFTNERWVLARWLGPNTSDRLVALLRSAWLEYASGGQDLEPPWSTVVPITVLAIRPTIEPSFVTQIVDAKVPPSSVGTEDPLPQFVSALKEEKRLIPLAPRCSESGERKLWLTLERLGCDDALLTDALARELTVRRPGLFAGEREGTVALLSEWDTLYGSALPESFAKKFVIAGGSGNALKRYTYLRGLDGQTPGGVERPRTDVTKPPDSVELFRQLLKSHAPSITFGRTQVDYIDRLAAQLRTFQRANPKQHLEAVGILGSDTYDKLLILQGLRKVFPSVEYFTTELDASLFAPEHYDVTHNLLVATGFDLQLYERYQQKILPFRDSAQASIYFATLYATQYFKAKRNRKTIGPALKAWLPAVVEIGRSGPYLMKTVPPAGSPADGVSLDGHSPLPEINVGPRELWQ